MAVMRAIFQAHLDGLYPESIPLDLQWSNLNSPGQLQTVTLNSGDNTLTVPTGTVLIAIKPPAGNGTVLKLRAAGPIDVFTLQANMAGLFPWSAGTVTINAAASVAGVQLAFL
jgi:hypothetical protein